jgi:hypothetical protein
LHWHSEGSGERGRILRRREQTEGQPVEQQRKEAFVATTDAHAAASNTTLSAVTLTGAHSADNDVD